MSECRNVLLIVVDQWRADFVPASARISRARQTSTGCAART